MEEWNRAELIWLRGPRTLKDLAFMGRTRRGTIWFDAPPVRDTAVATATSSQQGSDDVTGEINQG